MKTFIVILLIAADIISRACLERKIESIKIKETPNKFRNKYAFLIEQINYVNSIKEIDHTVRLIKNTFSNSNLQVREDYEQLTVIIELLKLKYYSLSDDIPEITTKVQRIYEHIIYEKSEFR